MVHLSREIGKRARTTAWRSFFVVGMLVCAPVAPLAHPTPLPRPSAVVRKETSAECWRRWREKKLFCIVCFKQCGFSVLFISLLLPTKGYSAEENFCCVFLPIGGVVLTI